jgi:hypothetical protein
MPSRYQLRGSSIEMICRESTTQAGEDGTLILPGQLKANRFFEGEPYVFQQVGGQGRIAFDVGDDDNDDCALIGLLSAKKLSFFTKVSTHRFIILLVVLAALFVVISGVRTRGQSPVSGLFSPNAGEFGKALPP